jgi:acyl-coenzyme A thioesterase PaaI-like protein
VRAEGKIVRVGKQVGQSDGVIYDDNGTVLAKGSATCLIFRAKDQNN